MIALSFNLIILKCVKDLFKNLEQKNQDLTVKNTRVAPFVTLKII